MLQLLRLLLLFIDRCQKLYLLQAGGVASTGMFNGSVQRILDVHPNGAESLSDGFLKLIKKIKARDLRRRRCNRYPRQMPNHHGWPA